MKNIRKKLLLPYHLMWAMLGKAIYSPRYKKLKVVGVTGTKGKTTVTELVCAVLKSGGSKVAIANGIRISIEEKYERPAQQSMPGRLALPKFLLDATQSGCEWAVVEMTSEGADQFRHLPISLDILVITNLAPEHLDAHGSFEKYREAKKKIVRALRGRNGDPSTLIVNGDDLECSSFIEEGKKHGANVVLVKLKGDEQSDERGVTLKIGSAIVRSPLAGMHNAKNILLASEVGKSAGVSDFAISHGIASITKIPGRGERIEVGQPFSVVVDYAHTPDSLEAVIEAYAGKRRICVFGSAGGGRDVWKRPEMGAVASRLCDVVIITEDDSYDENVEKITSEIASGAGKGAEVIIDRRQAIRRAFNLANTGDVVIIAGMGAQSVIHRAKGKNDPWNDALVCREELKNMGFGI